MHTILNSFSKQISLCLLTEISGKAILVGLSLALNTLVFNFSSRYYSFHSFDKIRLRRERMLVKVVQYMKGVFFFSAASRSLRGVNKCDFWLSITFRVFMLRPSISTTST